MKRILSGMLCLLLMCGCTGYSSDKTEEIDGVTYYISSVGSKAFAGPFEWDYDEENPTVLIQEKVKNAHVTRLGGYMGTGVPIPFAEYTDQSGFQVFAPDQNRYGNRIIKEDVTVTVYVPSTVESIFQSIPVFYGRRNENGMLVFRRPLCTYIVDPRNDKLPKEDTEYPDDMIPAAEMEETLWAKLIGRYTIDTGNDETEVWEFFRAFDQVYIHINYYMEGTEYMYTALEVTPDNLSDLDETDRNSFSGMVRQFSSFAMAGQYTELTYPHWLFRVTDEGLHVETIYDDGTIVEFNGADYQRDDGAISQFPNDPSILEELNENGEEMCDYSSNSRLIQNEWDNENWKLKIYDDGVMVLRNKDEVTPVVYKGISQDGAGNQDQDIRFAFTSLGGTTQLMSGRVTCERNEDSITFTVKDGYDGEPLIPYGESSITFQAVK